MQLAGLRGSVPGEDDLCHFRCLPHLWNIESSMAQVHCQRLRVALAFSLPYDAKGAPRKAQPPQPFEAVAQN